MEINTKTLNIFDYNTLFNLIFNIFLFVCLFYERHIFCFYSVRLYDACVWLNKMVHSKLQYTAISKECSFDWKYCSSMVTFNECFYCCLFWGFIFLGRAMAKFLFFYVTLFRRPQIIQGVWFGYKFGDLVRIYAYSLHFGYAINY